MSSDDAAIFLDHVSREHRAAGGATALALPETSLEVRRGTWTAVTGRSGSGKTTLLQLVAGLDRASSGRIRVFGEDVTDANEATLSMLRRRRMGLVHQQFHFIEHLPVWWNVTVRSVPDGVPAKKRRERAAELLAELGLEAQLDRSPRSLSGGEQQRVALARALVAEPDLFLADEPTSNVDADTGRVIAERLTRLRASGATLVVATHDPVLVALADTTLGLGAPDREP